MEQVNVPISKDLEVLMVLALLPREYKEFIHNQMKGTLLHLHDNKVRLLHEELKLEAENDYTLEALYLKKI